MLKFLHMNSAAAGNIIFDIDIAVSHAVAESVAAVAVNNYFAAVHCVAHGILTVSEHNNSAAV